MLIKSGNATLKKNATNLIQIKQIKQIKQMPINKIRKVKLRISPWLTDSCNLFLNNIFKWYPTLSQTPLTVLEFGGGNSTIFFLQKNAKVVTIESNDEFIDKLSVLAKNLGFTTSVLYDATSYINKALTNDLTIIKAKNLSDLDKNIFQSIDWTFIINDGISRMEITEVIQSLNICNSIFILDNVEYCANWGRLDRTSAKPDLIRAYRNILRDENWRHYIFEQEEGRSGHSTPDLTGWEAPHRWASAVLWRKEHLLNKLIVTNLGFPVVNSAGLDDADIDSLGERCPYDWKENKWIRESFPLELNLGLFREFD